jgi:hypothetical protein|tara:strand:+ start:128 stop:409 length:282 start_codon:yes stop_codon:yes gene_type:complete
MKNIKDITISIFAVIGFVAIITAFTNQSQQANQPIYGTPESHVWECYSNGLENIYMYELCINKVTGEMRKVYQQEYQEYWVLKEGVPKQKKKK